MYASFLHIRKLLRMFDWTALKGMDQAGQWLYAAVIVAVYYGQTGVISQPQTMFARWKDEVQQAKARVKLQRTLFHKRPLYFRTLHAIGFQTFDPLLAKFCHDLGPAVLNNTP